MHVVFALGLIAVCGLVMLAAVRRPSAHAVFLATLALFAIGYYGLPMLLIGRSALRFLPEDELLAPIAMALVFLLALFAGFAAGRRRSAGWAGLRLPALDAALERHWWTGMIGANAIIIWYNASSTVTFYQVENVESYLATRTAFSGLLGFLTGMAQALAALYLAQALQAGRRRRIAAGLAGLAAQLFVVYDAGQRLIFITPLALVLAALAVIGAYRIAAIWLGAVIAALLVISPFAVALRSGAWNSQQDIVAANFSYGDDPVDTVLQSVVDRGDILQNMVALKAHVDRNGHAGPLYYWSVLAVPIPRFLFESKPYVLSDNGTVNGEASVIAWHLLVGNTLGSLTAFGPIVAYREGGWPWVPLNGALTGFVFACFLTVFSRGGTVGRTFFVMAFIAWSIRKVPPSLMEVMVDVMTYLPVILALVVADSLLRSRPSRTAPASARGAA